MKKFTLLLVMFTSFSYSQSFGGKWSSEGDIVNQYVMNLNFFQSLKKISGIVEYDVYNVGKFSYNIKGYVKDGVAYVRFRDKNDLIICDGRFKYDSNTNRIFFKKSRGYNHIPILTYLSIIN